MSSLKKKASAAKVQLPRKNAGYEELSDFFDQHEEFDLLHRGIVEIDSDHEDLERMLIEYWNQPNGVWVSGSMRRGRPTRPTPTP